MIQHLKMMTPFYSNCCKVPTHQNTTLGKIPFIFNATAVLVEFKSDYKH